MAEQQPKEKPDKSIEQSEQPTKQEPAREQLTREELVSIVNQLSRPQPYGDLQISAHYINLCNKLSRMIDQLPKA